MAWTVARRAASLWEMFVGWMSGRRSGRQTTRTRIGAASPQGRRMGPASRRRYHSRIVSTITPEALIVLVRSSATGNQRLVQLYELDEVLEDAVAKPCVPDVVLPRVLPNPILPVAPEYLCD